MTRERKRRAGQIVVNHWLSRQEGDAAKRHKPSREVIRKNLASLLNSFSGSGSGRKAGGAKRASSRSFGEGQKRLYGSSEPGSLYGRPRLSLLEETSQNVVNRHHGTSWKVKSVPGHEETRLVQRRSFSPSRTVLSEEVILRGQLDSAESLSLAVEADRRSSIQTSNIVSCSTTAGSDLVMVDGEEQGRYDSSGSITSESSQPSPIAVVQVDTASHDGDKKPAAVPKRKLLPRVPVFDHESSTADDEPVVDTHLEEIRYASREQMTVEQHEAQFRYNADPPRASVTLIEIGTEYQHDPAARPLVEKTVAHKGRRSLATSSYKRRKSVPLHEHQHRMHFVRTSRLLKRPPASGQLVVLDTGRRQQLPVTVRRPAASQRVQASKAARGKAVTPNKQPKNTVVSQMVAITQPKRKRGRPRKNFQSSASKQKSAPLKPAPPEPMVPSRPLGVLGKRKGIPKKLVPFYAGLSVYFSACGNEEDRVVIDHVFEGSGELGLAIGKKKKFAQRKLPFEEDEIDESEDESDVAVEAAVPSTRSNLVDMTEAEAACYVPWAASLDDTPAEDVLVSPHLLIRYSSHTFLTFVLADGVAN